MVQIVNKRVHRIVMTINVTNILASVIKDVQKDIYHRTVFKVRYKTSWEIKTINITIKMFNYVLIIFKGNKSRGNLFFHFF